jgi:serine protease inhibitor
MRRAALILLPALALAGCGGAKDHTGAQKSSVSRDAPSASPADVRAQAGADDAFAGRLYATLAPSQQTFAVSPFSISQALAMTSAGARGTTLAQLERALGFALPHDRLHAALNAIDSQLAARERDGIKLDLANSLWGQSGLRFAPPFLDTLARDYGAAMRLVDYRADADGAARRINAWVAAHTHDKIQRLLAPGTLDESTRLVLVNAVYLKADWADPFDPNDTAPGAFHAAGGDVSAKFMHREGAMPYVHSDGYQAVELTYKGGQLAMDLILPDKGRLAAVEGKLGAGGIAKLTAGMRPARVALGLPKLDLTSRFELADALKALGARDIFSDHADLSGITTEEALQLARVVHEVKLRVDEKGTEAAAATAPVARATAAPAEPPIAVTLDRPFILAVRDKATGENLFLARVEKP